MCLSSTRSPSVTESADTPVARQIKMALLLNWQQSRVYAKSQNLMQSLLIFWRRSNSQDRPDLREEGTGGNMYAASSVDQDQTLGTDSPRAQPQWWLAAAFEKPIAAHQTIHQREHAHQRPVSWGLDFTAIRGTGLQDGQMEPDQRLHRLCSVGSRLRWI